MFCPDIDGSEHKQSRGREETTYIADLNSLGYSIVELPVQIGRLSFVKAVSIKKVVD